MQTYKMVISDLDGTISDCRHRRHLVEGKHKDWDAFTAASRFDAPNQHVIHTLQFFTLVGIDIWIMSGRSDVAKEWTKDWLDKYYVPYGRLIMRKGGDYTEDATLKERWVHEWGLKPEHVLCVFEDRDRMVRMWRDLGFTCYQVAPGDF